MTYSQCVMYSLVKHNTKQLREPVNTPDPTKKLINSPLTRCRRSVER